MKIKIYTNNIGAGIELMPCFRIYIPKSYSRKYGFGIGVFGKIITFIFECKIKN